VACAENQCEVRQPHCNGKSLPSPPFQRGNLVVVFAHAIDPDRISPARALGQEFAVNKKRTEYGVFLATDANVKTLKALLKRSRIK
jgi:hypothetical protein